MIIYPITVKSVSTKLFEVSLLQLTNEFYVVVSNQQGKTSKNYSEEISDFKTASMIFDLRIVHLEGN